MIWIAALVIDPAGAKDANSGNVLWRGAASTEADAMMSAQRARTLLRPVALRLSGSQCMPGLAIDIDMLPRTVLPLHRWAQRALDWDGKLHATWRCKRGYSSSDIRGAQAHAAGELKGAVTVVFRSRDGRRGRA